MSGGLANGCNHPGCDRMAIGPHHAFCALHAEIVDPSRIGAIMSAEDPEERGIAIGRAIAEIEWALARLQTRSCGSVNAIIRDAESLTGFTVEQLRGPRLGREVTQARFAAILVARQTTAYSLTAIGRIFNRDHTSIMNACRRAEALIAADPDFAEIVRILTELARVRAIPNQSAAA